MAAGDRGGMNKSMVFETKFYIKLKNYSKYTPFSILCYTDCMQKERSFWSEWAHFLHRWGLAELAGALLESAGPLNVLLAQLVYAGRPFLGQSVSEDRLSALAVLFEDKEESRTFAAFLREESSR